MSRIEDALGKAAVRQAGAPPMGFVVGRREAPPMQPPSIDSSRLTNEKLVVLKTPASLEAEEFRKLKEALIKTIKVSQSFNNVILITSAHHSEGKSLVATNLAISLAQEYDYTVLLVDADLRLPTCDRYLDITAELGLSDCLMDGLDLGKALVNTGIGKLVLLPAGKKVKNPLELFSSSSMKRLITEIKERYSNRIVLIDTPPILMFAETRTLGDLADGALLVVREGETSLEDVQECISLLNNKILGLVYNATEYVQPSNHYINYHYSAYQQE